MKWSIQFLGIAILSVCALLGCERRIEADVNDGQIAVENAPVIDERPRGDVDADIKISGPRGNGVSIDVDGQADRPAGADGVDIRVDADRPLRRRDRDGDAIRVRETPRGVKVDVRD